MTTTSDSFKQVRVDTADVLRGVGGLNAYPIVPGQINLPAAVVAPSFGVFYKFDTTQSRGSDDISFTILILVANALSEVAQDQLDDFLPGGVNDLKHLLEGNMSGKVDYFTVDSVQNYALHEVAGAHYFGMQMLCTVGVEPAQ